MGYLSSCFGISDIGPYIIKSSETMNSRLPTNELLRVLLSTVYLSSIEGSVLGPLLFILYATPLSSIISQSSVNHKLYADDTQLFLSFSADAFQKIFYSCKILCIYPTFLHGWPQTFYLSTLLKLNFFSLDFQRNFLKFKIPHLRFLQIQQYNLFLLLEILVLSLILIVDTLHWSGYHFYHVKSGGFSLRFAIQITVWLLKKLRSSIRFYCEYSCRVRCGYISASLLHTHPSVRWCIKIYV